MNSPVSSAVSRKVRIFALSAGILLVLWTTACHLLWLNARSILHGLVAFFLGAFVLVLLQAAIRLVYGTMRNGRRWLFSRAALRICAWTVLFALSVLVLFYNVERWRGQRAWAGVNS